MSMLVGYTGFVGSNICRAHAFEYLINSKNIEDAYGVKPDTLIYSGVPSAMFLANNYPDKDKAVIDNAKRNIELICPGRVVLISTVAVYDNTQDVDEEHVPDINALLPYGAHRLDLENWVEQHFEDHLIVRLPALFGEGLKKNFIYDYINFIPALLTEEKYHELSAVDKLIECSYFRNDNGFFKCKEMTEDDRRKLKTAFEKTGFSALNFTDSRSVYQFFGLNNLYHLIEKCLSDGIRKINLVTPPVSVSELYRYLSGKTFENITDKKPFAYDIRTKYYHDGYIMSKEEELVQIKNFVSSQIPGGKES